MFISKLKYYTKQKVVFESRLPSFSEVEMNA